MEITNNAQKQQQKIGSQLLFLSKEEARPEIGSEICLSRFSNESSGLEGPIWKAGNDIRICTCKNGYKSSSVGC